MAGEFLNIPGNIKQIFLPFVLDPHSSINSVAIDVASDDGSQLNPAANGKPQFFSFKTTSVKAGDDNAGFLKIFPNSFSFLSEKNTSNIDTALNSDISYSSLYDYAKYNGQSGSIENKNQIDFTESILNNLPTVQIREYIQDAKLDQVFSLFQSFSQGWNNGTAATESNSELNLDTLTEYGKKIWNTTKDIFKNIKSILKKSFSSAEKVDIVQVSLNQDQQDYVLKIPYILYYKLLSTTTTNIYEIPYSGKIIDQSDGTNGWNTKLGLDGITTNGNTFLGSIVNFFGKNIRCNISPTWDGADQVSPFEFTIDFDLYNDTIDAALINFIFVNTIVPGNKYLQYHIYQHQPNLYDIKIGGLNRFFMCAGKFSVDSKGVLRRPSPEFFDQLLVHTRFEDTKRLFDNDLIRIPDIYSVHLTFTSLLPNNFNNYLFNYYINNTIDRKTPIRSNGSLVKIADALAGEIKKYYNNESTSSVSKELDSYETNTGTTSQIDYDYIPSVAELAAQTQQAENTLAVNDAIQATKNLDTQINNVKNLNDMLNSSGNNPFSKNSITDVAVLQNY